MIRSLTGRLFAAGLVAVMAAAAHAPASKAQGEVNIYSYRQPFLIEPLLTAFTEETGTKTNVIYSGKGLVERMSAEGANSPADVLLTVDIGRLRGAVDAGVAQPVNSPVLESNIPAEFRGAGNDWFGLTLRSRVVYASKERVDQDSISYEELADPKWRGRICIRDGQHPYNVALFASIVAHHGEEAAKEWLAGFKDNLARKPSGNDRAQVKAIYAGECDIGLGNTYYMGKMLTNDKEPEQKEWAKAVKILFPNAEERGSHVNVSGMVMAKHAPNPEQAKKLMEFLSSEKAQRIYAEINYEYPVKPGVPVSDLVASWGELNPDSLSLTEIAELRKRASELVDEVGFNEGPSS
jgi:iron(III) transport system substrate-binding protein